MIHGITVIGDLLRPNGRGDPGGVDAPTIWLFNAIKRQLRLACDLPVAVLSTRHLPHLAEALRAERPIERAALHWAANYQWLADRSLFDRLMLPHLQQQFCIGYELPPWLVAVLGSEGIPHIDLRIHPVRFLDDLLFAARASTAETQAALMDIAVAETEVIATAGLREAMCQLITTASLPDNTLLVLGQRQMDATQIVAGRFFDAMEHVERIVAVCHAHRAVLLKPHPQEREHSLLIAAAGIGCNVIGVTDDNLYRLLSLPSVTGVLTVNSSAAYEAAYFDKPVHTLVPHAIRLAWFGDTVDLDRHVSIDDRFLAPDFWRLVLASHTPVSRLDGVRLAVKPNRLRIALDGFWNYQEIDTHRIPARPR